MVGSGFRVAVVGAAGVVGREMVRVLVERRFPVSRLGLFATARSAGKRMAAGGEEIEIEETSAQAMREQDIVLFAGGDDASRNIAWTVAEAGGVAVDNSSPWRMDPRGPPGVPQGTRPAPRRGSGGWRRHPGGCAGRGR